MSAHSKYPAFRQLPRPQVVYTLKLEMSHECVCVCVLVINLQTYLRRQICICYLSGSRYTPLRLSKCDRGIKIKRILTVSAVGRKSSSSSSPIPPQAHGMLHPHTSNREFSKSNNSIFYHDTT